MHATEKQNTNELKTFMRESLYHFRAYAVPLIGLTAAFLFLIPMAHSAQQIIESDDAAKVTRVQPAGTLWTDKTTEGGYQFPMSFVKDKPFMASGNSALTSGWGYLKGPGTGAELRHTFSGQNSVSVGFLAHAQGQIAEIYIDDVLKATVDTVAPSSIDYGGVAGVMRELCIATGLSSGSHTIRIRNTGTHSYSPSTDWDSTTKTFGGRGTQLVVDFIRVGDYAFGSLKGTVKDGDGTPIINARISLNTQIGPFINEGQTLNYTDGNGYYNITGLPAGTYTLTAKRGNKLNYAAQVAVTGGGTLTHNIAYTSTVNITRPRMMAPTVVARGDTLLVEVAAPASATGWTVSLANQYKTIPLTIATSYGTKKIWNSSRPGWQLTAAIPAGTPLELWSLVVSNSGGTGVEHKSVKVLDTYNKSFYITHLTDTHCDTRFKSANDATFAMMLEEIDIINPNFLVLSGDFCQSPGIVQAYDFMMTPIFMNSWNNTACIISRGNHESPIAQSATHDDKFWETIIGQLTYSIKMGPVRLFCHDIMRASSKTWLQTAYAQSQADSSDKVRIYETHALTGFSGCWYPSSAPLPTVTLYGHYHSDGYDANNGLPKIQTGTAQQDAYKMRLVRFNRDSSGGWTLGSVGYNGGSGSMTMAASPTAPYIKRTFTSANDGTVTANSVSIINQLAETFEHASARFIMAKGTYEVFGGTVIDSYDSDDNSKTIVIVNINVAANVTTSATIALEGVRGVSNGSFERPVIETLKYNPTGSGWTFIGNSGIQRNGSAWGADAAPDGVQQLSSSAAPLSVAWNKRYALTQESINSLFRPRVVTPRFNPYYYRARA